MNRAVESTVDDSRSLTICNRKCWLRRDIGRYRLVPVVMSAQVGTRYLVPSPVAEPASGLGGDREAVVVVVVDSSQAGDRRSSAKSIISRNPVAS